MNLPVAKRGGTVILGYQVISEAANAAASPRRGVRRGLGIIDMTQEESFVMSFLQERPESAFSRGEIARKAMKRSVYEADRHWVDAPLASLVAQHLVVVDKSGNYQLYKPDDLK